MEEESEAHPVEEQKEPKVVLLERLEEEEKDEKHDDTLYDHQWDKLVVDADDELRKWRRQHFKNRILSNLPILPVKSSYICCCDRPLFIMTKDMMIGNMEYFEMEKAESPTAKKLRIRSHSESMSSSVSDSAQRMVELARSHSAFKCYVCKLQIFGVTHIACDPHSKSVYHKNGTEHLQICAECIRKIEIWRNREFGQQEIVKLSPCNDGSLRSPF